MLKYKRREGGRVRTTAEGGAPSVNEDGEGGRNTAKAPSEEAASGERAERERERERRESSSLTYFVVLSSPTSGSGQAGEDVESIRVQCAAAAAGG